MSASRDSRMPAEKSESTFPDLLPEATSQQQSVSKGFQQLMKQYLSTAEVRAIDRDAVNELAIPSLILMENAARGTVDLLLQEHPAGRIVILCGAGNNGGDGLAVCRQLAASGTESSCVLVAPGRPLSADAAANHEMLIRAGIPVAVREPDHAAGCLAGLTRDDWIVDAMLGTGIRGTVRDPFATWIHEVNASPARVLAIDVPSGMDADSGEPCGICISADLTVTFVAAKSGFQSAAAQDCLGRLCVAHIGIPAEWLDRRH